MDTLALIKLIDEYKFDQESVYNTWFIGGVERMKAFRVIWRGVREKEVMAQLARPAFRNDLADITLAFIPFADLRDHCDALCKFGEDHTILQKIARHHHLV